MPGENIGGLNYEINITGDFDAKLKQFESRVNALQKKSAQAARTTGTSGGTSRKRSLLSTEEQQEQKSLEARLKKIQKFNTERVRSAKRTAREERKAQQYADVGLQAKQRNVKAARELAIKQAQINQLVRQHGISQRAAADQVGLTSAQAKQLKLNMFDAQHAARQFLFTFRRLVGILAIFTLARKFAQALGAAVNEMSRFNAELETAEIGIAAIVASVGQVRNAQGDLVTGADAFAASLAASQNILSQLKKDAIGSIATFEALVKSYQVAIGPGLAAGLDLDQIRVLSKRLAEGAISLGVPLNQLSEEIRSLLQGTATARNTRIAVLFGGAKEANEAIRNAKEQGNLYEVLQEKLEGVGQGAEAATQSFNVLKSDLQDALQLLLAEGGIEYFDQLKDSLAALRGALTEQGGEGFVFSPEAVGVVQEVAGTLAEVVSSFRELTDTGQTLSFVRNIIASIGDVLKALAPVVSGVFQGLITGANLALAPLRFIVDVLRIMARGLGIQNLNKFLAQVIKYLVAGALLLKLWNTRLKFSIGLKGVKALYFGLQKVAAYMVTINALQKGTNAQLFVAAILTGNWATAWALVNVQALITGGGIALLVAGIGFLLVKTGALEKLFGTFNKQLTETEKEAARMEHFISSAGDATAEGAKSAKEWTDEFRKLDRELAKARGIQGLVGGALDINELFLDMVNSLTRGTYQWEAQREAAQKVLSTAEDELKVLKEQEKQIQRNLDIFGVEGDIIGFGGVGPSPAGEAAIQQQRVSDARVQAEQRIREAKAEIADITQKEIRALEKQTEILEQQRSINVRIAEDVLWATERESELAEILNERVNVSVRELAALKAKNEVRKAEIALARISREEGIASAQADLKANKAQRFGQTKFYAEQIGQLRQVQQEQTIALSLLEEGTKEYKKQNTALDVTKARIEAALESYTEAVDSTKALTRQEEELNRLIDRNKQLKEDELAIVKEINEEEARREAILAGSFSAALKEGLQDFTAELPALGEQIAEIVSGSLSDLAGVVGQTFMDAIDPRTNADLATAFGEFFLNLAGQFVEAITAQLISSAISLIPGLGTDPAESAQLIATKENTLALKENTLATKAPTAGETASTGGAGGVLGGASGGDGGGADAATEGAAKAGGFIGAIAQYSPLLLAILLPIIIGLITSAFKKGGKVKGFASGGDVKDFSRPSHIPTSDTVPAWLTPGEFVIRKDAVRKYGLGLMNALNNGVLNPRSFSATGMALGGMVKGIQHFANGGGVSRSARTSSGQESRTVVLPVLPATEGNMEQMITGGRSAFSGGVNKVKYIGDPNKSRW